MTVSLEWSQVQPLFEKHGCMVIGQPEMEWYRDSWGALENAGLTRIEENEFWKHNQSELKLRAICFLAMYLGIYQAAGEFSQLGGYFSGYHELILYMETLDMEMEEIWELVCHRGWIETNCQSYWEDEETDDDILIEFAQEIVSDSNKDIFEVLKDYHGGNIGLFASLWNSRLPEDRKEDLEDAICPIDYMAEKLEIWEYVSQGMVGWSWL